MRQYNIRWSRLLDLLPIWERLPLEARRVALGKLQYEGGVPLDALDGQGPVLLQSGLAERTQLGNAVVTVGRFRAAMTAMRAMLRDDLFGATPALYEYLQRQFTQDDCVALLRERGNWHGSHKALAARAECPAWIKGFLAAGNDDEWLGDEVTHEPARGLHEPAVFAATQRLVRHIMSLLQPPTLGELACAVGKNPRALLPEAIRAGIEGVLLFPALRADDLEPVLGIWPAIAQRLHRARAVVPAPMDPPPEVFCAAWWMEDVSCLVAAAAREPLRLRADMGIHSRQRQKIEAQFMQLPEWLVALPAHAGGADTTLPLLRLSSAESAAQRLGLIQAQPSDERQTCLTATPEGMEWLASPPRQRLKTMLDGLMREPPRPNAAIGGYLDDGIASFLPGGFQIAMADRRYQPRAEMAAAFATLGTDRFYDMNAFIRYQSECANPIPALSTQERGSWGFRIHRGLDAVELNEVQVEACWAGMLEAFIWQRLAPLGGVAIGRSPGSSGCCCLALTGAGRYLLGQCEDFEYGRPAEATLLVQPNFEIVFVSPDPVQEAACSRFAERLGGGRHVGTLFRITKASILGAASVGIDLDQVLAPLASASAKPLPGNVEQEIRGWFASFRSVSMRATTLIECPDAETATRALACAGADLARISDVVLEYRGAGRQTELIKAMRAQGLFVAMR